MTLGWVICAYFRNCLYTDEMSERYNNNSTRQSIISSTSYYSLYRYSTYYARVLLLFIRIIIIYFVNNIADRFWLYSRRIISTFIYESIIINDLNCRYKEHILLIIKRYCCQRGLISEGFVPYFLSVYSMTNYKIIGICCLHVPTNNEKNLYCSAIYM